MIQNHEQTERRQEMFEKGTKPEDLPVKVWRGSKIPTDVRGAINVEDMLNIGCVYGDKNAGDPMGYDNLTLVPTLAGHDARCAGRGDTVEIAGFKQGIRLFMWDNERINRVFCALDALGEE